MPFNKMSSLFSQNISLLAFSLLILAALISFSAGCSKSLAARTNENNPSVEAANKLLEIEPETEMSPSTVSDADEKTAPEASDSQRVQSPVTLYDFRSQPVIPPLQKIGSAEQNIVWKYVYGASRQRELDEFVDHRFAGAFTAPSAKETLYVVKGEKGGNDYGIETTVAIYNGTTPVTKIKISGQSVLKITDLNGDGQNELFLDIGDVSNGSSDYDAAIVQVNGGQIKTLKKFPNVFSSADSPDHEKTGAEVAVISYAPAGAGEFPSKYSITKYRCLGSEGEVNPKTCRPAKSR